MPIRRRHPGVVPGVLAILCVAMARATPPPCPAPATLVVTADNASADATVSLAVSGIRLPSSAGCDETGLATAYATVLGCSGTGRVRCGTITGLAPGAWVHRMTVQVAGSAMQVQAQRGMLLAGTAANAVDWTVFGRTAVVTQATDDDLLQQLDDAQAYTGASGRPALVRFDPTTFPGAASPQTILVKFAITQPGNVHVCDPDAVCADGRHTAYCLAGSRVTVDALDAMADPGGVVLDAGTCSRSLLRITGGANVLRGLVLRGSQKQSPTIPVDTVAVGGGAARRNRLEACTVVGPTLGDAISIEDDAGGTDELPDPENVVVRSEITGAEDKGVKVDFGGVVRMERSCVHDNLNGGVQVTLGGTATVTETVVQHNIGNSAANGLFVGVPNVVGDANALATRGNVVRFNGRRGISVVNHATATLAEDVVTDNYRAGLRVETTLPSVVPAVTVRGATFTCNYAPGACLSGNGDLCRVDAECALTCMAGGVADGAGVALDACTDPGCQDPSVDLGATGSDGGNGLALNANPAAPAPGGVNLSTTLARVASVPASGNEWEHCDTPGMDPVDATRCYVAQVAALDVRIAPGAAPVDLGMPVGPRFGPAPSVTSATPARPRAGGLVRLYGGPFDAIDVAACQPAGLPADLCSAENPAVVDANVTDADGHDVTVTMAGQSFPAEVHQVTPGMLVVKMPIDCFAPATVTVARGGVAGASFALCDPGGCLERAAGTPCDDDSVCTTGETCAADGTCAGGTPLTCDGPCAAGCDPLAGCLWQPADTACSDGDVCTAGDHCSGADGACVAGSPVACAGVCLTGACDPASGCVVADASTPCDDGDACTGPDHCSGGAPSCDGASLACDDGHACTDDACDPASGCAHVARSGLAGVTCHLVQLRALVGDVPRAKVVRRLDAKIGCAERRITAAADAAPGSAARRRRARRADACVGRALAIVSRAPSIEAPLRDELGAEGSAARDAIHAFFALP